MLQKRFVDRDGMVWVYDRRRPERGFFRSAPKGVFKERHLYTIAGPDGEPSALVEQTLGRSRKLRPRSLTAWLSTSVLQRLGSDGRGADDAAHVPIRPAQAMPEFFRGIPLDEPMQAFAEGLIADWEEANGRMPQEERERHLSADGLRELEQSARMKALMTLSPRVVEALNERGLTIARIPRSDRQFILASLPVVRFMSPSGHLDLGDSGVELWLPIAQT